MTKRVMYRLFQEVTIVNLAKLGKGPQLVPGRYKVEVIKNQDSSEVAFYKGKHLVARVPATFTGETTKPRTYEAR